MSTSDFWAKCPECRHVWSVIKLPMEIDEATRKMIAAFCPACGNDSPTTAVAADIPTTQQDLKMKNIIPADGKFIIHKADPARPRRQHATKEIAEAEAQRLLGRNPADTFVIAQEVARVVPHG